ncbi:MFS transporter [Alteromonas lipolytica]|uniref:MFS transporter permease n=1 Tax=Alteromonas lipolytica TaxID=1856405 RepID=A0A1E8FJ42_9ALTE|nr:MFS transporter [Alteromonas lipolytica]OFI35766.1 MFS transporter permease [Alteromonas lipolytica]GGF80582.1 MFS transporter [Alteromonas lipolytica]
MDPTKKRLIASLACTKLADLLISAKTTLPALMLTLGVPAWMISWLVPIRESGALLPQAAIGVVLRHYPARHHIWRLGMVVQSLSILTIVLGAWWFEGLAAGWFILGGLTLLSLGRSACSLTMKDIQADVAEKGERGKLLGIASTTSGVLTLLIAVPLLFFSDALGEALIFGLIITAVAAMLIGLFILLPVKTTVEAKGKNNEGSHSWWDFDAVVYKFIAVRGLFVHSALVAPYFMLETEQDAASLLPFYLGAQATATMLSSFIWGSVADYSARLTLQLAGVLALIACVGLLLLPGHSLWISGGLFFVLAVAHTGVRTGRKTYSLDVKEGQARTELVAFSNTAIGLILLGFGALYAALKAAFDINIVATMAAMLLAGIALSFILPKEKQSA